jgi:transcriptional regulator with XRE-family HTH domain
MEEPKNDIVSLARAKRLRDGLSIRRVAELTGVSFATLSRLERGQGSPDENTIVRIVKWLGPEADQLDLPISHVADIHFRASKNIDAATIEALVAVAEALLKSDSRES